MFPTLQDTADALIGYFRERYARLGYGEGHEVLLRHAAFPAAITPDLLYLIWQNFREFPQRETRQAELIDPLAVSDVLLWSGWRQTSPEVFELEPPLRAYLLDGLRQDTRFGPARLAELAQFLFQYARHPVSERDGGTLREAQQLVALTTLAPDEAVRSLTRQLNEYVSDDKRPELLRMRNLLETLDSQTPDPRFSRLFHFTEGLKTWILDPPTGESDAARPDAALQARFDEANAVVLTTEPLPGEPVLSMLLPSGLGRVIRPRPKTRVSALLVGIDDYGGSLNLRRLNLRGAVNDVNALSELLLGLGIATENRIRRLTNGEATRRKFETRLLQALKPAQPDDLVLIAFFGHGLNARQGSSQNAMLFSHPYWQENASADLERIPAEARLTEREFYELILKNAGAQNPHVVLLTDSHHGSPNWLDPANEKHVILTAGSDYDLGMETTREGRSFGAFAAAVGQALRDRHGALTYSALMGLVGESLRAQELKQTPQAFGPAVALRRAVFGTGDSGVLYAQELAQACGYENSLDGHDLAAARRALAGVVLPPSTRPELADLTSGLERLAALGSDRRQLRVLVLGREVSWMSQILADGLAEWLAVPYQLQFQEAGGEDFQRQSIQNTLRKGTDQPDPSTAVILLLSQALVADAEFQALADKLVFRSRFGHQRLFPVLLEEVNWRASSLRLVPPYPRRLSLSKSPEQPVEWTRFFREIAPDLNAFAPFLPKTPIDPYRRATGVVHRVSKNFWATGFLVGEGLLLTTHGLLPDPKAARTAERAGTLRLADEEHRLTVSFRLDPERFFLTSPTDRYTLVAVEGQSEEGSYALADFPVMPPGATVDTRNTGFPGQLAALVQDNQEVLSQRLLADFRPLESEGLHFSDPYGAANAGAPLFSSNPWQLVAMHPGPSASSNQDVPLHITRSIRALLQLALDQATPPQQHYLRPRLAHWFDEEIPA